MQQWFCARVNQGKEQSVAEQAVQFDLDSYAPVFTIDGRGATPVFRSYAFLQFDIDDHWDVVKDIRGIVKCLPLHSVWPVPVPDDFMVMLRRREDAGDFNIRGGRLSLKYGAGEPVQWRSRNGATFAGTFVRQERHMAVLSMLLFNQLKEVMVPARDLVRA